MTDEELWEGLTKMPRFQDPLFESVREHWESYVVKTAVQMIKVAEEMKMSEYKGWWTIEFEIVDGKYIHRQVSGAQGDCGDLVKQSYGYSGRVVACSTKAPDGTVVKFPMGHGIVAIAGTSCEVLLPRKEEVDACRSQSTAFVAYPTINGHQEEGAVCTRCNARNHYAEPSNTYVCWECR